MPDLHDHLTTAGFTVTPLRRSEFQQWFAAWCEAFLAEVRRRTGAYRYRNFHWHAYSFDFVAAEDGDAALAAYTSQPDREVLVIPENWSRSGCGVRCRGDTLPTFAGHRDDLYVFPPSLAWSMAFTHEQPWLGPFFVLRSSP